MSAMIIERTKVTPVSAEENVTPRSDGEIPPLVLTEKMQPLVLTGEISLLVLGCV